MLIEYTWLVPLIPMLCFLIIGLLGRKTPEKGGYIAIAGALIAFIISAIISYEYLTGDVYPNPVTEQIAWFSIGDIEIHLGYYVDGLTCMMMLFSSFISTLIFIYSIGYMGDQGARKTRYYAEVSLFLTGMLGLIVSSNFLELFIFWEVMGLCSYLLIGFWSFRHADGDAASANAASAAKKAFLVTRMGDVCLMAGLFILLGEFHSLDYTNMFDPAAIASVDSNNLTLAMLLVFGGVIGKSAQFPLHDWLPDAMAGPTTVSSLIHAATMVKAGVYLVARAYPLFIQDVNVMLFVGLIGGFTAFFAATMALNNMNIKRVLAYSTISQLGYMILGLGAGGYLIALGMDMGGAEGDILITAGAAGFIAGCFHMMNHAFFKALLFMCSGSVIHAVGTEDMREMGGLGKHMKITSITMLLGSLSIAGFPLFSGFWSKDLVIEIAMEAGHDGTVWFTVLWILAIITAFMTAFYMFRMWFMTFMGEEGHASQHCHGESPKTMTTPLVILSVFAVLSGFLLMFGLDAMISFDVAATGFQVGGGHAEGFEYFTELFTNSYTYLTIVLALVGIGIAYVMYVKKTVDPGKFNKDGNSWLYKALTKRWWFPDLYNQISWKLGYGVAKGVNYVDRQVIDGTVNGLSAAVVGGGDAMSKVQTGNVHDYASVVLLGVAVLSVLFVVIAMILGGM
ncbi:MAG: proton-translocating NADH-quinone oxidoreductase subunit L [Candidatus Methanoprimaticola hominis]|nr:MAG: proton-translocating NADH-quinone oxidoreductase subunit L [Methanomassiliicoccales archaeon Mx-06]